MIKNPLLSTMLNEQQIANAFCDVSHFGRGAGNALGNNFTLGAIPRDSWSHPAFVQGQRFGDGLSVGLGAAESYIGSGITGGGGMMMIGSGGALVPVAAPFAVGGAAMTAHGSVVMSKALLEYKGKDGGNKQSRRGDPHTNREAKGSAWKNYQDAKKKLADYRAEARTNKLGGKVHKRELKKREDQVKHWKKQADATGETHGRKGKGTNI